MLDYITNYIFIWVYNLFYSKLNCSSYISFFSLCCKLTQTELHTHAPISKVKACVVYSTIPIYMSTSLNSVMTHDSIVMKTKLGHSLKLYDRNGLPFFSMTYTLTLTLTHSFASFLLRKKIASFPMSLSQKSKCDLSAYKYTILHFIQHTTSCSFTSIYVCVCVHLFLKLYLYKYHLSVHVYIYLTNSIYLQISGVQYFLLINRTCRFTYCFFVQILTLSCSFNEIVLNHHSSRLNKTYTYDVLIMTS